MKVYKDDLVATAVKSQLEALLAGGWSIDPPLPKEEPAEKEEPVLDIKKPEPVIVKRKLGGK